MLATAVTTIIFYALALSAVVLALELVLTRHILRSAIYLMGVLLMSAGFYLLLAAEFLAGVQVLVYVGGIVVLLVFAVMLTTSTELLEDQPTLRRRGLALLVAGIFFILTATVFLAADFPVGAAGAEAPNNTALIGRLLLERGLRGYVLPFEVVSLLLLAAAIGGIVVARKTPGTANSTTNSSGRDTSC